MIETIRFENFKALKNATLNLGPFNVLVGPNGSGKSSVFQAFELMQGFNRGDATEYQTIDSSGNPNVVFTWEWNGRKVNGSLLWQRDQHPNGQTIVFKPDYVSFGYTGTMDGIKDRARLDPIQREIDRFQKSIRIHSFDPTKIPTSVQVAPSMVLAKDASNLAGALDRLRDQAEDNYAQLRRELHQWLPEYDGIVFDTPRPGHKTLKLRQTRSQKAIASKNLSEGTLVAMALLLIAHDHNPPDVLCLEEPERNIHPRLLKDVRDALYRLSFPKEFGLNRKPIQIIVTTHSPIFLNLLEDHPESIIIAEKHEDGTASFRRADEDPHFREILGDSPLGEVWLTGILGGVPALK